jgi:hypothetical protein
MFFFIIRLKPLFDMIQSPSLSNFLSPSFKDEISKGMLLLESVSWDSESNSEKQSNTTSFFVILKAIFAQPLNSNRILSINSLLFFTVLFLFILIIAIHRTFISFHWYGRYLLKITKIHGKNQYT